VAAARFAMRPVEPSERTLVAVPVDAGRGGVDAAAAAAAAIADAKLRPPPELLPLPLVREALRADDGADAAVIATAAVAVADDARLTEDGDLVGDAATG